ncbi:rpel repeat [Fusarium sporotrichioides]|uniref:Rpel repeat n=1 Tax=Fusarium sporotrichioides TaxID=5514 RepID=A0A395SL29_FUSSP|nr:rpel repeat [Fusarium sporotrichioides]
MADTTEQQQPKLVDDSPISPVERRNSLEAHLKHRPERSELIEKNILPASNAAPGLLAHQKEVSSPPLGQNIYVAFRSAAADKTSQLEKHMLEDKLNDKISHRPDPESLIKEGVLRDDPRAVTQDEAAKKYDEAIEDEYAKREGGA